MERDDELCLCFHVTRRKLENYIRLESPQRASQLSDCYGAGTGCGWCRPYLKRLFEAQRSGTSAILPDSADFADARSKHVRDRGITLPPGATPVDGAGESTGD